MKSWMRGFKGKTSFSCVLMVPSVVQQTHFFIEVIQLNNGSMIMRSRSGRTPFRQREYSRRGSGFYTKDSAVRPITMRQEPANVNPRSEKPCFSPSGDPDWHIYHQTRIGPKGRILVDVVNYNDEWILDLHSKQASERGMMGGFKTQGEALQRLEKLKAEKA